MNQIIARQGGLEDELIERQLRKPGSHFAYQLLEGKSRADRRENELAPCAEGDPRQVVSLTREINRLFESGGGHESSIECEAPAVITAAQPLGVTFTLDH